MTGFNRNKVIVIFIDACLLVAAYFLAFVLRFEGFSPEHLAQFKVTVIPVVVVKIVVFSLLGLHKGPWRFTGVLDLINVARASILGSLVAMAGMVYVYYPAGFSRAILVLDAVNTIFLVGLFRLFVRIAYSHTLRRGILQKLLGSDWWENGDSGGKRTLIYGANERGEMLLRSLISSQETTNYRIVGIIDDDPNKKGVIIHGIGYKGTTDDLEGLIQDLMVSEVIIASDPGKETIRRISGICREQKIPVRVVPPYLDIVHQRIGVSRIRKIDIEDLLRRDTVKIDYSQVEDMIRGKRVLITGAAGSIGRQLCLQILEFQPAELVCVDMGENPLFFLRQDLHATGSMTACFYYCFSVTSLPKLTSVFERHKPHMVFHAAAHKHVPMMEMNVDSAILNNVGGTKNVADLSEKYGVQTFVFISTDKAVRPTNAMGWSKRMGEVYTQSLSANCRTKLLSVRFGNVLGSNGSVVPIFQKQIEDGGPVQVTHPDTTRYFMTIPEAVLLILQSVLLGGQGDIMILDMGEPIRILDLAEEMIRLAGFVPGKEIEMEFIGLRPGEKLHEELMYGIEERHKTSHPKITLVKRNPGQNEDIPRFVDEILATALHDSERAYELMKKRLAELV